MRGKWIWPALVLLICLSGCAGGEEDVLQAASAATAEPVASEVALPSATPTPAPTPSSAPTPAPTPTPTPAPTPTPEPLPLSLTELCPAGPRVLLNGRALESLLIDGTALIRVEDLMEEYPEKLRWTPWKDGTDAPEVVHAGGDSEIPPLLMIDGVENTVEAYAQWEDAPGVWFAGQNTEFWLPVRYAAAQLGLWFYWDGETYTAYLGTPVDVSLIPQQVRVPVLMYHAVSDDLWGIGSLFVSPSDMRAQLDYLTENGYEPIFFSDLTHLEDYSKPIILTFDDGYDDNYTNLFPLLQEYGVKATVFIITGMLEDEHYLTVDQVREMSDSGLVDIQSHTVTHDELATLSYDSQEYQLAQSWLDVARITGKMPYVVAYPSGSRNDSTLEIAPRYYCFGVDMGGGVWTVNGRYYRIDRVYVSRYDTLGEFAAKIS